MTRFLLAALVAFLTPLALAQTCSTEWTGAVGDDFNEPLNWTNGAPNNGGVACIIAPGTYTVALRGEASFTQSFGVVIVGSEGAGRQTLALVSDTTGFGFPNVAFSQLFIRPNGGFDVYGGGILDGTAIANAGIVRFASGGNKLFANTATLTSTGTVEFDRSGMEFFTFQGSLVSEASGTIRFRGPRARLEFDNNGHIISRGLLTSSGGSGDDFNFFGGTEGAALSFVNDGGRMEVTDGELRIGSARGLRLVGGEYDAAAGARLLFDAFTNEVEGTLTGAPAGAVEFTFGGAATSTGAGAIFNVGGTGARWRRGALLGTWRNEGLLVATTAGGPTVGAVLTNVGRIEVDTPELTINGSGGRTARLVNEAAGVIAFTNPERVLSASQGGRLVNRGRIVAENGAATISSGTGGVGAEAGIFHDGGRLEATGGNLTVSSGTTRFQGGTYVASAGNTLLMNSTTIEADGVLAGEGDGLFQLGFQSTPDQAVGDEGVFAFGGSGLTVLRGGFIGTWRNTGRLTFARGEGHSSATFTNEGVLVWTGGGHFLATNVTFVNAAGGRWEHHDGGSTGGFILNYGLIVKTAGTGLMNFASNVTNAAGGEIRAETGELVFAALSDEAGAVLSGTGRLTPQSGFVAAGTIAPGNAAGAAGTLTWGRPLLTAPTFVLDLDVSGPDAGTGYDQLVVTGTAALGGTAVLRQGDGYFPAVGSAFPGVLTATAVTGAFATETLAQGFSLVVGATAVDAVVTSPVGAEDGPEPGEVLAFAVGALSNPSSAPSLRVTLAEAMALSVDVFDVQGRRVAQVADDSRAAGTHVLPVAGLAPGVYVARVVAAGPADTERATQRLVVVR